MPTPIAYPAELPAPQELSADVVDTRLQTDPDEKGPVELRTIEQDERQRQSLVWTYTSEQVAVFRNWWLVTLVYGGAWFSAPESWPDMHGLIVRVRRFITAPQYVALGKDNWRVMITAECRGETLLPNEPEPEDGPLWLDNFTGSAGVSLVDHPQDIPLDGSVWVPASIPVNQPGVLDGAGHATASSEYNSNDISAITNFTTSPYVAFGYRFECDVIPVINGGESFEGSLRETLIAFETFEYRFELVYYPEQDETPAYLSVNGGDLELPLIDGLNTLSVTFEADGWTATFNGAAQSKVTLDLFNQPRLDRVITTIGTGVNDEFERIPPYARIDRLAIYGTRQEPA